MGNKKVYASIDYRTYFVHGTLHLMAYNPKMKHKIEKLVNRLNDYATENEIPIIFDWSYSERYTEHYENFFNPDRMTKKTKKIREDVQSVFGNIL